MMPARLRRALANCALASCATGLSLLAAEAALRLHARFEPAPEASAEDPELAGLPRLENVFELARPNARGVHRGVLWRTNSAGFRGPEATPRPAPGVFRIAVVGDSFAAGDGVREEDAYAAQLERRLAASGSGARFEVLNFGLGGLNIAQVFERAARLGARFHPHLFVYGLTLNDIDVGNEAEERFHNEQRRQIGKEMLRFAGSASYLLRALWPRLVSLRQVVWPRPGEDYGQALAEAYRDPEKFARIERGLEGFEALADRSGVCVHVLIHTELAHLRFAHPFRDAYDRIERAARERGLTVTQSFPDYRGRDSGELRVSLVDGHPNAEGHRILADALYAGLRELPPHCQFPTLP
ncbi:MAG TPA: GDSL-type esterase/lipase family protein [Myxococcota bacterium]|nr:GDSL-type esterase/lipase family protein [Myxococcota bacterium]